MIRLSKRDQAILEQILRAADGGPVDPDQRSFKIEIETKSNPDLSYISTLQDFENEFIEVAGVEFFKATVSANELKVLTTKRPEVIDITFEQPSPEC